MGVRRRTAALRVLLLTPLSLMPESLKPAVASSVPLRRRDLPVSPELLARDGTVCLSDYGRCAFGSGASCQDHRFSRREHGARGV